MKNYQISLKPKGSQFFKVKTIEAENLSQAEEMAKDFKNDFETEDKKLEDFIKKCGGLEAVVTPL